MEKKNPPVYHQTYINVGSGPVVILLHGLFGNLGMWMKTVETLKKDFHVVVPRFPIFDLPAQNTNVKYLLRVLEEFIEWKGYEEVSLVGHAIGGQIALMYAQLNPTRVQKIVLTGSVGLFQHTGYSLKSSVADHFDEIQDKVQEAFYLSDRRADELVDEVYAVVKSVPKRVAIDTLIKSSNQTKVSHLLNEIDHPVLLLWGLEDRITSPEVALHFYDYLKNSELKLIEQCGHVPMVENPDEFNKHLLSFLQR